MRQLELLPVVMFYAGNANRPVDAVMLLLFLSRSGYGVVLPTLVYIKPTKLIPTRWTWDYVLPVFSHFQD